MNKRGLSQVFKYILIAVVGAIILVFFINLARQQIFLKEELNSAVLSRNLNSNFDSFSVSGNADKTIDFKEERTIHFNRLGCGKIGVDDLQPVNNQNIIFSPNLAAGDKLHMWTATWKMPFSVTNFFYVLGEDVRLEIVGGDKLAKDLRGENNNVEFIPERFFNSNENSKRIIVQESEPFNLNPGEVAVYGYSDCDETKDNYLCKGKIKFGDQETIFLGKEMLYAAIFSNRIEDYQCGTERAFERLTKLSNLYQEKANALFASCNIMGGLSASLENIKDLDLAVNPELKISQINVLLSSNKQARSDCGIYLF